LADGLLLCESSIVRLKRSCTDNEVSELSQTYPLRPITTAIAHLARAVTVIRLAIHINVFTDEDICFTIAELATV
jgi:hypothetical protein